MPDSPVSKALKTKKIKMIKIQLKKIRKMYKEHQKKFKYYKKLSTSCKVATNLLNAVTVSSVVLSFSGLPIVLIVTVVSSTISGLISVVADTVDFHGKMYNSQTSYLQLLDLYSIYKLKLISKNPDYDDIITEINHKLGIILDSSLPVSISGSNITDSTDSLPELIT